MLIDLLWVAIGLVSFVLLIVGFLATLIGVTGLWDEWRIGTTDSISRRDRKVYRALILAGLLALTISVVGLSQADETDVWTTSENTDG